MYKKLQLNKTNAYELAIGTYHICEMLVDFIHGECKYKALGKEQGDVDQWDDYILTGIAGNQIHYQIKDYNTNFSTNPIVRGTVKRRSGKIEPSDPSEFDKAITALLAWYKRTPDPFQRKTKKFIFASPFHPIEIKKGLPLTALADLCNNEIKGNTDVEGLERLTAANPHVLDIYDWLKSWCGFASPSEVLGVLSHLKIESWNRITEIKEKTEKALHHYFDDAKSVRLRIEDIITTDTTFSTLTPTKYVLKEALPYLRSSVMPWSKYRNKDERLFVSGMQDISNDQENPPAIIAGLWDGTRRSSLYIDIPLPWNTTAVYQNLLRLCLHLPAGNQVHAKDAGAMITHLLIEIGQTIGNDPLENGSLPIRDASNIYTSSVEREVGITHLEAEAESLSAEMSRLTWNNIAARVSDHIRAVPLSLRTELDRRWSKLQSDLEASPDSRDRWLQSMMHPKAEARSIRAHIRVGPATSSLLAKAILYQLVVLTALEAPETAMHGFDGVQIQTLALRTWSGPADALVRRVYTLAEKPASVLGKETCGILILPQVDLPREALRGRNLASSSLADQSLAAGNQIKLAITTVDWQQWIDDGDLDAIKRELRRFIPTAAQPPSSTLTL